MGNLLLPLRPPSQRGSCRRRHWHPAPWRPVGRDCWHQLSMRATVTAAGPAPPRPSTVARQPARVCRALRGSYTRSSLAPRIRCHWLSTAREGGGASVTDAMLQVQGASQPAAAHGEDAVVGDRDWAADTRTRVISARHNPMPTEPWDYYYVQYMGQKLMTESGLTYAAPAARSDAPPCVPGPRSSALAASPGHPQPTPPPRCGPLVSGCRRGSRP